MYLYIRLLLLLLSPVVYKYINIIIYIISWRFPIFSGLGHLPMRIYDKYIGIDKIYNKYISIQIQY